MRPNILLIILDSVRAQNTSLQEHQNRTTPFLKELSSKVTNYTHARSPSDGSQQSHASIFTGLHPEEHGCFNRSTSLQPGYSIWEYLKNKGYNTGVFSTNPYLSDLELGLRHGFETIVGTTDITDRTYPFPHALNPQTTGINNTSEYLKKILKREHKIRSILNGVCEKYFHPREGPSRTRRLPSSLKMKSEGEVMISQYLKWISKQSNPWAACINFMDSHSPWFPRPEHDLFSGQEHDQWHIQRRSSPTEFNRVVEYKYGDWGIDEWAMLEPLYDGAIHEVDNRIRQIVRSLRRRDVLDKTFVVITSDHGEGFGEYDPLRNTRLVSHGASVSSELTHVPLLTKFPNQSESIEIDPVATLRMFPTAVREVVENDIEIDKGMFVPEGRVTASAQFHLGAPVTEALKKRYGTDVIEKNTGVERLVVWKESGKVRQIRGWLPGGKFEDVQTIEEQVFPSGKRETLSRNGTEYIEKEYEQISKKDVTTHNRNDISEDTAKRLKELGYK